MKTGWDALGTFKNESGSAKHENKTDTLSTAVNQSGRVKHDNWTRRPRYRQKHVWERKI
jgi:hypothetical protein